MKRILYFFTLAAALMAVSCQRELPGVEENLPLVYGDVNVSLGQADPTDADGYATKSLISVDTEDFVDAYLFAFNASTKKILTYTDGTPMAIYTTSKTFDWTLAIGTKMDIWVVANPGTGNAWKTTLQSAVTNASLTESDLSGDKLMFKCASSSALKALETSGAHLPMSAMENGITLTSPTQSLSIKVKRLFAKYNIYLDTSLLEAEGYTIKSTYLASSKSNTEVPFFYQTDGVLGGYAQTDVSKLATIDRNTEEDLTTLENGQKVTLYFLENCQGTKTGASKWSSVYNDLGASAVELCSYMEVGVNVSRSSSSGKEPVDMSYAYRIYLGKTDMKSDFNVQRNLFKTIKLTLPVYEGEVITEIIDGFKFTNTNSLSVAPGETITVPFETSVNTADDISYKIFKNGVEDNTSFSKIEPKTFKANTTKKTGFAYEGTVALTASSSANEGTYELAGIASEFKDKINVAISSALDGEMEFYVHVTATCYHTGGYIDEFGEYAEGESESDFYLVVESSDGVIYEDFNNDSHDVWFYHTEQMSWGKVYDFTLSTYLVGVPNPVISLYRIDCQVDSNNMVEGHSEHTCLDRSNWSSKELVASWTIDWDGRPIIGEEDEEGGGVVYEIKVVNKDVTYSW